MADIEMPPLPLPASPLPASQGWRTRLSHMGRAGNRTPGFINPPVHRGSTMLYANMADRRATQNLGDTRRKTYGIEGGETHHALEDAIAEIEGGTRCLITGSGLAAVTTPLLAYLSQGDHVLITDGCYGPTRTLCEGMLRRYGIDTTYYRPTIEAAALAALIRPNTRLLYVESPSTHTFEMQDVPALAAIARAHGLTVMMDNTWGFGLFSPFAHGVDVAVQALTKYASGHSDLMLGSIVTNTPAHRARIYDTAHALGHYASPDDCWLALRGLRTLAIRLEAQGRAGLEVAHFLASRPEVRQVRHPALPGAPGYALWARDFSGTASLFGVELQPGFGHAAIDAFIDALRLFGIGASWGGYESLILPSLEMITRAIPSPETGPLLRLHIGLEDVADLLADLERGFRALRATRD